MISVNSDSFAIFESKLMKFIQPFANSVFSSHNPKEIKLITSLRLCLSHLCERKFKYSFPD